MTVFNRKTLTKVVPERMRRNYGREYLALFRLGLPVLVTQAGIITVNFADTMMVGAYGTEELASAAFVNSLFVAVTVMLIGFGSGMIPLVGALFGRDETRGAGLLIKAGAQMNVIMSLIFTVIMIALYPFLDRFGQPEELMPLIRPYYLIILGTVVTGGIFSCLQQTANALNDTKMPMWIILGCNVVNIFGNWVLIFGKFGAPELGLVGAGISTLVARAAGAVAILWIFLKAKRYHPYRRWILSKENMPHGRLRVWNVSFPVMVQNGVECAVWSFGAIVCGWFGKVQLASFQVVNTMAQLGFMTYISFGVAASVRVANAMGLNDFRQVRHTALAALHLNLVLGTLASLVFIFCGKFLIGLFTSDPAVIAASVALIFPLVLYQYGDAVQLTYANALRGTGDVTPLLWTALIAYVLLGAPSMILLGKTAGLENVGVYYSFSICLFAAAVLLYYYFRRAIRNAEILAARRTAD